VVSFTKLHLAVSFVIRKLLEEIMAKGLMDFAAAAQKWGEEYYNG
jgi:hypothetical protein